MTNGQAAPLRRAGAGDVSGPDPIALTRENVDARTSGLPRAMRHAFRLLTAITQGTLSVTLPDGRCFRVEGDTPDPVADLTIHSYAALGAAMRKGDVGVAEGFIDGHLSSTDLTRFLELFCYNAHVIHERIEANPVARFLLRARHWLRRNTPARARRNIAEHYDLGNAFYRLWLDPSMTYSSAVYPSGTETLEAAQREKFRALADAAGIVPGTRVLDIGCGWGGLAIYLAAERGAHVTGLTISQEQYDHARAEVHRLGLDDRVDIELRDYRLETGRYDRVVSVEMFEAVGEAWWPVFFERLAQCLRPGGRAVLQVITIQEQYFEPYRRGTDFIQHYVFPGGMLPTPTHLLELGADAGLQASIERSFGPDYARTLRAWRNTFLDRWDEIADMGFDMRFKRLWLYYLHYCEAGFDAGNIDVKHVALKRPDDGHG